MKPYVFAIAALLPLAAPGSAHAGHRQQPVRITEAWARETAPTQVNGGAFLTITNHADQPDRLVSATSPVSTTAQLHTMSMDGGVMRMRELPEGIPVPAKAAVELKPGGLHIMFIGLKAPLKPGQIVKLTLRFEKAGMLRVTLPVRPVGAMGMARDQH
jgi:copper(I)-binding protein